MEKYLAKNNQQIEVVTDVIVSEPNEKIFLATGLKFNGYYVVPGGHIEYGETIKHAVKAN